MQEPEPKIVGRRADLTNDQSAGNPTKPSATSAPPEAAKTWLTLPPVAFNEADTSTFAHAGPEIEGHDSLRLESLIAL